MRKISDRQVIAVLVGCCVVLYSVAFLLMFRAGTNNGHSIAQMITAGDSEDYIALAHTMLETHRFAISATSPTEFFRPPGYPAFLAILFALGIPLEAVPFIQIALTAFSVVLVFFIGKQHVSRTIAFLAACLYGLEPMVFMHTMYVLTEPLFMPIFLGAVYLAGLKSSRWILVAIGVGVLMGVAALIRPVALYIIPLTALLAAIPHLPNWRKALIAMAILCASAIVVMAPWAIRNKVEGGHLTLSTISTYNMLFANLLDYESLQDHISVVDERAKIAAMVGTDDWFLQREFGYYDRENQVIAQLLKGHIVSYAEYHIIATAPFFVGTSIGTMQLMLHQQGILPGAGADAMNKTALILSGGGGAVVQELIQTWPETLERIAWILICILSFFSAIWRIRKRNDALWFSLAFLIICAFAILTGPASTPRYRIPVEPFLFLLSFDGAAIVLAYARTLEAKLSAMARESLRYLAASAVAFAVDAGLLVLCTQALGIPYLISGAVGFCAGLIVIYEISRRWVFSEISGFLDPRARFALFASIGIAGLALTEFFLWLFTSELGFYYLISKLFAAALVFVWDFAFRKFFLFRAPDTRRSAN